MDIHYTDDQWKELKGMVLSSMDFSFSTDDEIKSYRVNADTIWLEHMGFNISIDDVKKIIERMGKSSNDGFDVEEHLINVCEAISKTCDVNLCPWDKYSMIGSARTHIKLDRNEDVTDLTGKGKSVRAAFCTECGGIIELESEICAKCGRRVIWQGEEKKKKKKPKWNEKLPLPTLNGFIIVEEEIGACFNPSHTRLFTYVWEIEHGQVVSEVAYCNGKVSACSETAADGCLLQNYDQGTLFNPDYDYIHLPDENSVQKHLEEIRRVWK